jgi:2-oxoglutarate dehydrogenase E2 component (dihydrolipoamide succinyltransferase)
MSVTLKVPSIGESIQEATVGVWKKAEGDWIQLDEPLVEIESEKATLEVPSPVSGVLKKILRQQGDTVAIGESLADIDDSAKPAAGSESPKVAARSDAKSDVKSDVKSDAKSDAKSDVNTTAPAPAKADARPAPRSQAKSDAASDSKTNGAGAPGPASPAAAAAPAPRAAPSARKLMGESGLLPDDVQGTGRGGRIQSVDVTRALEARSSVPGDTGESLDARAQIDSPFERVVPMTALRKTIARRLVEAQHTAAILTTFNEVDMSEVMALRERHQDRFTKQHGVKLGFTSFFVKAAIDALRAYPAVNAEVRGTSIIYKDHYDIGVAVGGGKGLVVPVVRDADRLSFAEVEKTVASLAARARENRLQMPDLEGGTFTISNGGVYGSMLSTPILNPPQSGILGLHSIQKRAVVIDDQIVIRPMMFVALSYDHRIVDGREAVQFLVRVKECVESPDRILLEV